MSRPEDTANRTELRRRGLELYLSGGTNGRPMALRQIAQQLGVHLKTVQYWRHTDRWDVRARQALAGTGGTDVASREQQLQDLMAGRLINHVKRLDRIIRQSTKDADRITAIKAYVEIFRRLGGNLDMKRGARAVVGFSDDVGGS